MKLKKCSECKNYSLKAACTKCGEKTKDAHYKFIKPKTKTTPSVRSSS